MSPEDLARRHEDLQGFDLVDYAEIALPIWQLSVEAISIAHRRLPPIQEYVLRSLGLGLPPRDIAGFLGLEQSVVDGALTQAEIDRFAHLGEAGVYGLTDAGARALEEEGVALPIEDQFQISLDGISRRPTTVPAEQIALPRDTDSGLLVEIPAIPPNRPAVADLQISDVQRFLVQRSGGAAEFGRDLIALKRITKYRRLFRRGIGLVFKGSHDRTDLRLKIIVGGVRAEDVEREFADRGGLSRPGFIRAFSDAYLNSNLRKHLGPEIAAALLDGDEAKARQKSYSIAKLKLSGIERKMKMVAEGAVRSEEAPSHEIIQKAQSDVVAALKALSQPKLRPAVVYEHSEFLKKAFLSAKAKISVSSLGLSAVFVDHLFLKNLESYLKRGHEMSILVDTATFERDKTHSDFGKPYISVQKLADEYKNLILGVNKENRYFHLAIDETNMLVSNRPFLSNSGRTRTFEQYSGYFVQDTSLTQSYLKRLR